MLWYKKRTRDTECHDIYGGTHPVLVELVYNEQRMLNWHEGGLDPWLDVNMPRSKGLPPELAERLLLSSRTDTPRSSVLDWINALLIDADCLYDLHGKLIKANGKFGKKLGKH